MNRTVSMIMMSLFILGCSSKEQGQPDDAAWKKNRVVPAVDIKSQKFIDDPAVIGTWQVVDLVKNISDFDPGKKHYNGEMIWDKFIFYPNGKTHKPFLTWTQGKMFHSGDESEAKYTIKTIGASEYLFLEHMSGDVLIRGQAPRYYVFVKAKGKT